MPIRKKPLIHHTCWGFFIWLIYKLDTRDLFSFSEKIWWVEFSFVVYIEFFVVLKKIKAHVCHTYTTYFGWLCMTG